MDQALIDTRMAHDQYLIRRKIFKLFGDAFHVYSPAGEVLFYTRLKAFKLKEDIRLYTGEDMVTEVIVIKARRMLDISSAYDVVEANSGQSLGTLKRQGLRSIVRDKWLLLDPSGTEIGFVEEENLILALIRRFITDLIPQSFEARIGQSIVCRYRNNFNPFVRKVSVEVQPGARTMVDARMLLAAGTLLCAIEGKQ